jgi:hypothetical protein
MPRAIQLVAGYYTAAGAGSGVATPMAGDTFNIANFTNGNSYLEQAWVNGASTDWVSVRSPRMHDNNQGIRMITTPNSDDQLLPWGLNQIMYSGDTPTVTIDETAAATGAIAALISYDDLPGANPRLAMWPDVQSRIKNICGQEVDLGAIGAIGNYSAGVAINATFDNFQAGSDYALLGYWTAASVLAIAVAGQDTGNLKVGGPGVTDPKVTRDWFITMSVETGKPCIPIIAANNKGSTLVYQTDSSAHAAQHVGLVLAELG